MNNELIRQALSPQPETNATNLSFSTFKRNSLAPLTKTQQFFLGKYPNPRQLLLDYTPDRQAPFARFPQKCLEGNSPTLADIRSIYGGRWAETWLEAQLKDLSEYAGTQTKIQNCQLEETARIILEEFYFLKLSELMLFFFHFKAGRYGRFYGSVDPLVITEALQDFKRWRRTQLEYIENQRKALALQQRPTKDPEALTREEWQELKWLFNLGYERNPVTGKIS